MNKQWQASPKEINEMFHLLRQLGDTQVATLAAWRDIQADCERRGINLTQQEYWDRWWDVATRAILTIKWLASVSPTERDGGPAYWEEWQRSLQEAVVQHIAWTTNLMLSSD